MWSPEYERQRSTSASVTAYIAGDEEGAHCVVSENGDFNQGVLCRDMWN